MVGFKNSCLLAAKPSEVRQLQMSLDRIPFFIFPLPHSLLPSASSLTTGHPGYPTFTHVACLEFKYSS